MNYEFQPTCQIPPGSLNQIYRDAFGGYKTDGTLVEIGAHDGWHWSNTWGLAKIGWRAAYVEPVADLYRECRKTYKGLPLVSVRNFCIGPKIGRVSLGMGEYGASVESVNKVFSCAQYTLDAFLKIEKIRPRFDLLVIDVEGGEAGVLAGFTLSRWHPKLVIIERPPLPNQFLAAGYKQVYYDWINTVYERPT